MPISASPAAPAGLADVDSTALVEGRPARALPATGVEYELTVLMPCLNEARTVGQCVRKAVQYLDEAGIHGEVVVADNGSTDGSMELALLAGARVVRVAERGYGAALIAGIEAAQGRYVIMGDADDSYDFRDLSGFVESLRGGADLVMGNRFQGGIGEGAMPKLHRYLGNPVLSFIGRLLFRAPVGDFHCGLRGFVRARALQLGLSSPGMEFASELVVKSALAGHVIVEIPTTLSRDGRDRPPHLRSWRDGWRHLKFLLAFSPRWSLMYPGMALAVAGWLGVAVLHGGVLRFADVGLDIHSMAFAVGAALVGNQLCITALLARITGIRTGLLPPRGGAQWIIDKLHPEATIVASLALAAMAVFIALDAVGQWQQADFKALDPQRVMRPVLVSVLLMVSAAEVVSGGVFLALLQFSSGGRNGASGRHR